MEASGQLHASADSHPAEEPFGTNSIRDLDWSQSQCGGFEEGEFSCLCWGNRTVSFRCPSCKLVIIPNILSRPTNETIVREILLHLSVTYFICRNELQQFFLRRLRMLSDIVWAYAFRFVCAVVILFGPNVFVCHFILNAYLVLVELVKLWRNTSSSHHVC